MKETLMEISRRKEQLEKELGSIDNANVIEMHPNLPEQYQQRIAALQDALNREESRQKAATILRTLIHRIVLFPKEGRSNLDIELHGDIAALLHLLQNKGGTSGKDVMKWLVAGVRSQLTLTETIETQLVAGVRDQLSLMFKVNDLQNLDL